MYGSSTKTIRFPDNLIADIETAITGTGCTFSAFVVEACKVAIENLSEPDDEPRDTTK